MWQQAAGSVMVTWLWILKVGLTEKQVVKSQKSAGTERGAPFLFVHTGVCQCKSGQV